MDRVERRFDLRSGLVVSLAAKYHLPAIYAFAYFPTSGGLVSYGIDPFDSFRRAPAYVDAILRGTKPQDLPVQFPTKFELVINPKTAKTLGLDVPQALLAIADRVDRMNFPCPPLAQNGHGAMSDLSPLCAPKRTSAKRADQGDARAVSAVTLTG